MNEIYTESYLTTQRRQMSADPHRPRYHFIAPANWMNDPHGLIEWQGQYHLFYQYNPHGPFHGTIHWGHAVSDDLLHWHDCAVALVPEPGLYDQDGCYTGCIVNENGLPVLIYTAVSPQTVAVAVSHDNLQSWQKIDENPVIDGPPEEIRPFAGGHFRDPFVWREDVGWFMLIASKIEVQGGQVLIYHSPDLRQWTYRGIFLGGDVQQTEPFWQGTMWECPNFLAYGARQVLILSVQATPSDPLYAVYFTGRREGDRFLPQKSAILVHGASFYAPQAMHLADGRWLMFGWLREERTQEACTEAGWNGAHSLPLVLELLPDGSLGVSPAAELQALRGVLWQEEDVTLSREMEITLPQINGRALEITAELHPGTGAECGLIVLCSPDGEEQTRIVYKPESGQIFVERDQSSLDQRADATLASMPVALAPGETLKLHIFVDHSVLEIFANDRLCLICRVYPTREDSQGVRLFSRQGETAVTGFEAWSLNSIWP